MTNSHVGHDCIIQNHCTLVTGAAIGGHSHLFDDVTLGGNSGLHQFCRMGKLSFLGALNIASKDIPPFTTVAVNNSVTTLNFVGLRRSGTPPEAINAIRNAFHTLYLEKHTNPVAIKLIEEQAPPQGHAADMIRELITFIKQSNRGICPHAFISANHHLHR
jgi:UDP-N-acetylglucosamine acyltransferase